jgi:hypothetical protein
MAAVKTTKHQKATQIDPKLQRFTNFRQEHTNFVTLAFGHAGRAKILQYDLDTLVTAGALHTAGKTPGTIFTMDSSVLKSQLLYLSIFVVMTGASFFALGDSGSSVMKKMHLM